MTAERVLPDWRAREIDEVVCWAQRMLANPDTLILDTETTDLAGYICEIGIIRMDGSIVLDTLVNPEAHNSATHIHGITREMTWGAPTFACLEPELRRLLHGHTVVVYNAMYDSSVLEREISRMCTPSDEALAWLIKKDHTLSMWARQPWDAYWHHQEHLMLVQSHSWWWRDQIKWECAMDAYAVFAGEPRGYRRGYKWQPLRGGHRAVGDCLACLELIKRMAATKLSTEYTEYTESIEPVATEVSSSQSENIGGTP